MPLVGFYLLEPFTPVSDPPFCVWAFDERQEVDAFLDEIAGDVCFSIHKHEFVELCEEREGATTVAVECIRWVPFQVSVSVWYVVVVVIIVIIPKRKGIVPCASGSTQSSPMLRLG